jgi:hypothetical protein
MHLKFAFNPSCYTTSGFCIVCYVYTYYEKVTNSFNINKFTSLSLMRTIFYIAPTSLDAINLPSFFFFKETWYQLPEDGEIPVTMPKHVGDV